MNIEYPQSIKISHPTQKISGTIPLNRSKSISNRVLIIQALCHEDFTIHNLADSDDTQLMASLIASDRKEYDAHHAGTTYRFLTSFLAVKNGIQILTGSSRMKERPIGPLVDALRTIGASIDYLENDGYPPLRLNNPPDLWQKEVSLPADVSSQYISSLMMIAPILPKGLKINLIGDLVSRPYLEMTRKIMEYFGAKIEWDENNIVVAPGNYVARDFSVEADWSAASYYYSIVSMAKEADLIIEGLNENSLQGDSAIAEIMKAHGVHTEYLKDAIRITKTDTSNSFFEYDFLEQPDLAQTLFVVNAAKGVSSLYRGLKTLRIKETDRIAAMQAELGKYQSYLSLVPQRFAQKSKEEMYMQEGKAIVNPEARIQTYRDHRMAMAFGPLALLFPIIMDEPGVVSKSYPLYWEHLERLGFVLS